MQKTFDLLIIKDGETKNVTVRLQELKPLKVADMLAECVTQEGRYKPGTVIEQAIEKGVIVSPKNLVEQIEEADNGLDAVTKTFRNIGNFLTNPKLFGIAKNKEQGKDEGTNVGDNI